MAIPQSSVLQRHGAALRNCLPGSPRPASHHSFHLAAESKVSKVSTVVVAVVAVVASSRFRQRNSQLSQEQAKLQGVTRGVGQLIHILEAKAAVHHGLRTSGLKDQGLTGSIESIEVTSHHLHDLRGLHQPYVTLLAISHPDISGQKPSMNIVEYHSMNLHWKTCSYIQDTPKQNIKIRT